MTAGTACSTGAKAVRKPSESRWFVFKCWAGHKSSDSNLSRWNLFEHHKAINNKRCWGLGQFQIPSRSFMSSAPSERDVRRPDLGGRFCGRDFDLEGYPWWLKFAKSQVMAAMGCVELLHILPFDQLNFLFSDTQVKCRHWMSQVTQSCKCWWYPHAKWPQLWCIFALNIVNTSRQTFCCDFSGNSDMAGPTHSYGEEEEKDQVAR